jgi:hypothetical protein
LFGWSWNGIVTRFAKSRIELPIRFTEGEALLEMIRRQEIPDGYALIGLLLHHLKLG